MDTVSNAFMLALTIVCLGGDLFLLAILVMIIEWLADYHASRASQVRP
jgi:hypothetical protein